MEWLASALVLTSTLSLALAIQSFRSHDASWERLNQADGAPRSGKTARGPRGLQGWIESWRPILEEIVPAQWIAAIEARRARSRVGPTRQRLAEAGFRSAAALPTFLACRLVGAGGGVALALPVSVTAEGAWLAFGIVAAAAGGGYLLPSMIVDSRRSARQGTIVRTLPDAIDLMVVCVEAGLGLGATIDRVAKEFRRSSPVISAELRQTSLETQAGKSMGQALRALGSRNGVQDLSTLTSALVQTERMGTRVADTLRVQSDALRTRRLQRAEAVAQQAPVKMLFPAGVFIFPALLAVTLVPAFLGTSQLFG